MIVLEQGNKQIELRNPTFPKRVLNPNVKTKRAMNGDLRTNIQTPRKVFWDVDILLMTIEKRDELVTFMNAVLGETVKLNGTI